MAIGAAIGAAIAGAAVSGAINYAVSASSQPKVPNLAASSKELANVQAELLPFQRQLEAAAQQGGKTTIPGESVSQQQVLTKDGWVPYNPADFNNGGKYATTESGVRNQLGIKGNDPKLQLRTVQVPGASQVIDFKGMGTAEIQSTIAKAMAKAQLANAKKYDSQFIAENLKQAKLADPEGFAARDKMDELIQKQINAKPDRPVAELLDRQIGSELKASNEGRLDDEMKGVLDRSVGDALSSRGGYSPSGDFEKPLTTGFAGEERQRNAAQKGISWLSSGSTPEDIAYRRDQQNLANLSAQVNGKTPESQFGSLSGAQQGPTPFQAGKALPSIAGGNADASAINAYGAQASAASNQVNNWTAGLSSLLGIAGAAGQAGWKPLAS